LISVRYLLSQVLIRLLPLRLFHLKKASTTHPSLAAMFFLGAALPRAPPPAASPSPVAARASSSSQTEARTVGKPVSISPGRKACAWPLTKARTFCG